MSCGKHLCIFVYVTHTNVSGPVPRAFQVFMHFLLICLLEVNIVTVLIPPMIKLRTKMLSQALIVLLSGLSIIPLKHHRFDSQAGHIPGLWAMSQVGGMLEATN